MSTRAFPKLLINLHQEKRQHDLIFLNLTPPSFGLASARGLELRTSREIWHSSSTAGGVAGVTDRGVAMGAMIIDTGISE